MKLGRNDLCACGSGRKYKKCCERTAEVSGSPVSPPLDLTQLFALLKAGRNAELEISALRLIEQQSQTGMLWKFLGAALFMQGKNAVEALQTAARLMPRDPEAQTNLGNALRAQGQLEEAAERHRRAIQLDPSYADAHNNLGSVLRDLQRPNEAVSAYRSAVTLNPGFAMAHNNLGLVLQALDRPDEAIACYRRATEIKPDYIEALVSMGDALLGQRRLEDAATCYRRVLQLKPDFAEGHNNLGNALRELGRINEAEDSYRRAVALQPGYAKLHNNLGNALLDLGKIAEAAASYGRALELEPSFARARSNLGSAQRELGRIDEAEATYRLALAIQPDSAEILTNLGVVQRLQGRAADAEVSFRRALDINPVAVATINSLAELHADRGQFGEAESLYRQACDLQPSSAQAWAGIAALRKMSEADIEWLARAQQIAQQPLRPRDAAHLHYAMGKYFDDVRNYDLAFPNYRRANEIAKSYGPAHDREALAQTFKFVRQLYNRDWLERAKLHDNNSSRPIFVIGMPRSGTSLVEQILASHPDVFGAGELPFWKTASLEVGAAALRESLSDSGLARLANEYLRLLAKLSPDAARVVDKMPGNFAHLGMIHAAFPQARIIHMQRNPVDTCLSIYFQNFHVAHTYANDLGDLAHYYNEYLTLMRHWRSVLPQNLILDVPYEALVTDPETWSREVVDFVGLPWNAACIDFHRTERRVSTFSKWQVRQKISRTSVERWRNYESFVAPLRDQIPAQQTHTHIIKSLP
jgi:tetratricopeptide (TPR) repeat protein